jgi:pimeloyl-ACP methyl ester carboxylesterase
MDTRPDADGPEARRGRDSSAASAREGGAEAIAQAIMPKMLAPTSLKRPDLVEQVRRMIVSTPVAGIVGALAAMRDRPSSESFLPTLAGLPTLVVVGEFDAVISPDQAREMAGAIPGSRLSVIQGAGHLPPVEQPDEVTRVLREFVRSIE